MQLLAFAESIQLVPDGTLFLHIALILLMIYVLNRTLFRPINHILEGRERQTHGHGGEAHQIMQRVDSSLLRYEQTLREARAESYRILEQQRAEAMGARQGKLSAVREEIETLTENQKRALREQSEQARAALGREAQGLAAEISATILGRPLSTAPQTNTRI